MQSQVRFNRVPEKVREKVPGGFGAEPGQVQRIPEKVPEMDLLNYAENDSVLMFNHDSSSQQMLNPNGWGPKSSNPRGGDGERYFRKQCLETSLKENSAKKAQMRGRRKSWPQAAGYIVPRSF